MYNSSNKQGQKDCGGSIVPFFHDGNIKKPLYERTARPFCITDVVKAVWRSQNEPEILCKQHSMRVTFNGVFLIGLKHVPLKDLVADGNGVFTNTGQPTHTIKISSNEDEGESEDEDEKSPQVTGAVLARAKCPLKSSSEFLLQRYYGIYFMVESHKCTGNIHSV